MSSQSPWSWDASRNLYYYWDATRNHFVYQNGLMIGRDGHPINPSDQPDWPRPGEVERPGVESDSARGEAELTPESESEEGITGDPQGLDPYRPAQDDDDDDDDDDRDQRATYGHTGYATLQTINQTELGYQGMVTGSSHHVLAAAGSQSTDVAAQAVAVNSGLESTSIPYESSSAALSLAQPIPEYAVGEHVKLSNQWRYGGRSSGHLLVTITACSIGPTRRNGSNIGWRYRVEHDSISIINREGESWVPASALTRVDASEEYGMYGPNVDATGSSTQRRYLT